MNVSSSWILVQGLYMVWVFRFMVNLEPAGVCSVLDGGWVGAGLVSDGFKAGSMNLWVGLVKWFPRVPHKGG